MSYIAVKHLHVTCVVLSISLFSLRGMLQWSGKPWRQHRWLRILPHINDTVLLGAALWMVFQLPPGTPLNWVAAKIVALLGYIIFGKYALSDKTPASYRLPFLAAALVSVGYIVGVALTHSPVWGLIGSSD